MLSSSVHSITGNKLLLILLFLLAVLESSFYLDFYKFLPNSMVWYKRYQKPVLVGVLSMILLENESTFAKAKP